MVHVAAITLEGEVVDALTLLGCAERERREHLRLAALEQAGAVRARVHPDLDVDRPDLLGAAAVGPPLVYGDLLPDDVLVDRVARLLDVRLRERVHRSLVAAGRERESHLGEDAIEEEMPLRGLELLRVLLGVGERLQLIAELFPHRTLDCRKPLLLEQHVEARPHLDLALDVVVGRVHRDRRSEVGTELLDDRSRRGETVALDPLPDGVPLGRLDLGVEVGVEPLRLAGLRAEILLRLAEAADLAVRELERLEKQILRHLVGAGLDHGQAVLRADDDEVEGGLLPVLLQRRVDDELAVDQPDAHRADRPEERQRRQHERSRRTVDAENVVRGDEVGREHGADDLHLVAETLRPKRPDRAVDHPRSQGGALTRASLALEEAAGDLARGVHPLLDVDRQREEVGALAGLRASHRGGENHRLARANDDCAVRLLRELAGFEADLLLSNLDGDLRPAIGRDTHKLSSTVLVESGSSSQCDRAHSLELPPS